MDTKKTKKNLFKPTDLKSIGFTVAACILGSLSMRFGGFIGSAVAAVLVGFLCAITIRRKSKETSDIIKTPQAPISPQNSIPDDRIDILTGLANENGLMAWFLEKSEQMNLEGKAILILTADLDEFALVEKKYGKKTSDSVLIEIASRISQCTGQDGIAARTEQDGFAAIASIVPSSAKNIAEKQASKLAEMIQRPVEIPTGVVWIGGFVGAATGSVKDGSAVLQNARIALKQAKIQGRGNFKVYTKDKQE